MADLDRERRLRELFDRAVSLPPSERAQVIAAADDELLAERLRALLSQDARGTAAVLEHSPASSMQLLRRVGNYELLRELGSGGMGTVVLARQVEPVERLVALKMIHCDDSGELAQRFASEGQALALMNHPGIARIFDGGSTDDGVPYFVMEYVRGEPITRYCDRRRLEVTARIELFVKVCDAVQHAHQKAVLHRDLKPGNVLVTEDGGSAQPKVIDFGLARALAGRLGSQQASSGGVMVGTFAYMSPEQADPRGQDVDTRADVYSLGAMLYELLTGELPFDLDLEQVGLLGAARVLSEASVPAASARLQALAAADQQQRAHDRDTTPAVLSQRLANDLDWILRRALEKDRNRRYGSAAELAADLQRHLHDEPVVAGPPTARYRIGKFVHRHRLAVLGALLLSFSLAAGVVIATYGMLEARAARDAEALARRQLERQLQRERAVGDYFEFLLFYGDTGTGQSPPSLREVLDRLTPTIDDRLRGRPVEASAVHAGVGRAYLATGESAKAAQQLQAAWDLLGADPEPDPAEACLVLNDLIRARRLAGGASVDRADLVRMLELGAQALHAAPPALVARLQQLAVLVKQESRASAPELQTRCQELLELVAVMERDAEQRRITVRLLAAVGMHLQAEGEPSGKGLFERIEQLMRQTLGEDVDFLQTLGRFADLQLRLGRYDRARRHSGEVLAGLRGLGLQEHWLQLRAERVRGLAVALGGEPAVGETELVALQRRLWSLPAGANEQARAAANVLVELCTSLIASDRLDAFLAASLQRWQDASADDPDVAPWWPADAEGLPAAATAAALAAVRSAVTVDSPQLQGLLGSLLLRQERTEAALPVLLEASRAASPQPSPELLADLAIAQQLTGNLTAVVRIVGDLKAGAEGAPARAERCRRALQRVAAAARN